MSKNYTIETDVNIPGEDICRWVGDNYDPDDVFASHVLEDWATRMGYKDGSEVDVLEDIIKDLDAKIEDLEHQIARMEEFPNG